MTKPGFSACLRSPSLGVLLQQGGHYSFQLADGQLGHRAAHGAAHGQTKPEEKPG